MELAFLWWLFFHITSPFLFIKYFFHYTYAYFFLINVLLLCFFFYKNKDLMRLSKGLLPRGIALAGFLLILCFAVTNFIYCMQPINNILPTSTEEIYQAGQFLDRHHLLNFERPHGFTVTVALARAVTGIDYPILLSVLGIIFAICTMALIFMTVSHLARSKALALMSMLLYGIHSITVYYSTTRVSSLSLSALSLCLLAFFYATDKGGSNMMLILVSSTLTAFMRLENLAVVIAFMCYLAIRYYKDRNTPLLKAIGLLYLLVVPQSYALYNYQPFLNDPSQEYIIGLSGTVHRIGTFAQLLYDNIGVLGIILLLLGAFYSIKEKQWLLLSGGTALSYSFLQIYPYVQEKYYSSLLPVSVILISLGVYMLYRRWRFAALLLALLIITVPHTLFSKLPVDEHYIKPSMDLGKEIDGEVVLFGYRDFVFVFQRFFPGSYIANDVFEEFDEKPTIRNPKYLVHLSEISSSEEYIESRLPIQVEFIKQQGVAYLYLVK